MYTLENQSCHKPSTSFSSERSTWNTRTGCTGQGGWLRRRPLPGERTLAFRPPAEGPVRRRVKERVENELATSGGECLMFHVEHSDSLANGSFAPSVSEFRLGVPRGT